MPKYCTSNASLAWFCEFNAELLRYHIHCLEVIDKVCHMPGFANEHSGYISRLASFQSICGAYWKRRAYWMNQGLPEALKATLFVRSTIEDHTNPAKGIRLNLNTELLQVLDDQRFVAQNKQQTTSESVLNYFTKLGPAELSRDFEEFLRRMVNLQSKAPHALKELLTVGTFESQTLVHLGVSRYKWKNVMNEFVGLFGKMIKTLHHCEYVNTKVLDTYSSKLDQICNHISLLCITLFAEKGCWDALEFQQILPIWFAQIVKDLEHASATAELALSHASNLIAHLTAPTRTQFDKDISPLWTKPPKVIINPDNPRISETVRDESRLNEAFLTYAYSAMLTFERMIFGVMEKMTLTTLEDMVNKLFPFNR
ncbi:hypothetical protein RvY_00990 [Ramazzottius varieornatus]|uniref:Uncharacterized protein n=1 Tax=Ramazzottius varieornatus TaxID=947166 RepID=A0A1D1UFM6_RAMVA|nr:hypothetical protein RvY_00990 [Ramazzottius varieornatus]